MASFRHTDNEHTPDIAAQRLPLQISELVIEEFFKQLSTIANARYYFLIDPDRSKLSDAITPENVDFQSFRSAARTIHATVIDPRPAFREFVSKSGRTLEVGPYDRHWNAEAIRIVANEIAKELRETDQPRSGAGGENPQGN